MSEFGDWPPELLARVIKAMAPERVCRTCGEPRRRIVEYETYVLDGPPNNRRIRGLKEVGIPHSGESKMGQKDSSGLTSAGQGYHRTVTSESFSDCGHDNWRSGVVLDPFGIGVTAEVASVLGRDGIEIDDAMPDGDS